MDNPTLLDFCVSMIGSADIEGSTIGSADVEGSKSNDFFASGTGPTVHEAIDAATPSEI